MNVKFKGRFRITKKKKNGEVTYSSNWQDNLITNNGLDLYGNGSNLYGYCQVGSGSSTPAFADTSLDSLIASQEDTDSDSGVNNVPTERYAWLQLEYEFGVGEAEGNISELGLSPSSSGNLWSRALIEDSSGNPTTITVLSDEILVINYEIRMYIPESDFTGTVDGYDYTARSSLVQATNYWYVPTGQINAQLITNGWRAFTGPISDLENVPSGTEYAYTLNSSNISNVAYTNGSHQRQVEARLDLSQGNDTLRSFTCKYQGCSFQVELDPTITKTMSETLTLTHTVTWGRI